MNLGLPLSSGCDETHQVPLRLIVKEEDIKEEECGHMITCQDSVEVKVKKEEDEQQHNDCPLESSSEHPDGTQHKIHGQNDELSQQLNGRPYHCTVCLKSFTVLRELEEHQKTHTLSVTQKQNTGASEHPDGTQQKIHGQNDELNQQLNGRPYHCTVCRKSFTVLRELEEHQETHPLSVTQKQNTVIPGSTFKMCISCQARIWVACKRCKVCGAEQPKKAALEKVKARATKEWAQKMVRGHNVPKVLDKASALVFQMQQVGLCPLLLFCRTKATGVKADLSTSIVPETDQEKKALVHIKTLFEGLVKSVAARSATPGTPAPPPSATPGTSAPPPSATPGTPAPPTSATPGTSAPPPSATPGTSAPPPSATPGTPAPPPSARTGTSTPPTSATPGTSAPPPSATPGTSSPPPSAPSLDQVSIQNAVRTKRSRRSTAPVPPPVPQKRCKPKDCDVHPSMETFGVKLVLKRRLSSEDKEEAYVRWMPCPKCGKKWQDSWVLSEEFD